MPAEAARPNIVTKAPPWHGWVTADLFLSSLGAGTFSVAAICLLARPDEFAPAARIAFLTVFPVMLADLVCLIIDLGDPARFHHMLRVFKPGSPMSVGVWTLSVFTFIAFIASAATVLGLSNPILEVIAAIGLIPALIGGSYKGVLLSTTAQPGWSRMRWLGAAMSISSAAIGLSMVTVIAESVGPPPSTLRTSLAATLALLMFASAELSYSGSVRAALWATIMLALPLLIMLVPPHTLGDQLAVAVVLIHALLFRHLIVVLPHRAGRLPAK